MKLFSMGLSPNALRSRAVIFELGLDVEIVDIDMRAGENRTPEFLALNPNGKVPVLVDGDLTLWESRAINAYLAAAHGDGRLCPAEPKARAIVDQWSYWHAVHLSPTVQKVVFERVIKPAFGMGEPDPAAVEAGLKDMVPLMAVLEGWLTGRDWIAGELSLADFALGSTFHLRAPAGIELPANVAAWMARLEARPSWQKATEPVRAFLAA